MNSDDPDGIFFRYLHYY